MIRCTKMLGTEGKTVVANSGPMALFLSTLTSSHWINASPPPLLESCLVLPHSLALCLNLQVIVQTRSTLILLVAAAASHSRKAI